MATPVDVSELYVVAEVNLSIDVAQLYVVDQVNLGIDVAEVYVTSEVNVGVDISEVYVTTEVDVNNLFIADGTDHPPRCRLYLKDSTGVYDITGKIL